LTQEKLASIVPFDSTKKAGRTHALPKPIEKTFEVVKIAGDSEYFNQINRGF